MKYKTKLFLILWLAGFAGVLSFQLVDLQALISMLPNTAGKELPIPMVAIRILNVIQTGIILAAAVLVGILLSPKVGLLAPATEALASGRSVASVLKPQIVPGLLGGMLGSAAVLSSWLWWKPFLSPEFVSRAEDFNQMLPPLTRLLYGGITEELLLRWGFMTFLVWAAWKVLQKGERNPRTSCFVIGIAVSSVVFGIGHLPIAILLSTAPTIALVTYVVFANSIFGLIAGYLFWKRGLESAIVAHMMAHVVLMTAVNFL